MHTLSSVAIGIRATLRVAGVFLALLLGALIVAIAYPCCGRQLQARLRARWSAAVLGLLGIRLAVSGTPPAQGSLIVSNHVSWLDVLAINAAAPASFVCKQEVRAWPLIGWLAARNDTVFVRRGSAIHVRRVNEALAQRLANRITVAAFPEGTTTDGRAVLGFRSAPFQASLDAGVPVQPIAIRYVDSNGGLSRAAPFVGTTSFAASMLAIAASPAILACVRVGPPLHPEGWDRRLLAHAARRRINALLHEELSVGTTAMAGPARGTIADPSSRARTASS